MKTITMAHLVLHFDDIMAEVANGSSYRVNTTTGRSAVLIPANLHRELLDNVDMSQVEKALVDEKREPKIGDKVRRKGEYAASEVTNTMDYLGKQSVRIKRGSWCGWVSMKTFRKEWEFTV